MAKKRDTHLPKIKLLEQYLERRLRQRSEYSGKLIYKEIVDTLITLITDTNVAPIVRLKATEVLLKYHIGLPVQRVDLTSLGDKIASPPIMMTVTSTAAEGAVQRIIDGVSADAANDNNGV